MGIGLVLHPLDDVRSMIATAYYERTFRALDHRFVIRSDISGAGPVFDRLFGAFAVGANGTPRAVYELLMFRIGARSHDPAAHDLIRNPRYELIVNGRSTQRSPSVGSMLSWVIADMTESAVSTLSGYAAVHASAASADGGAVILPAPPAHGKTTTVAALVRDGWQFLTDEAALISLADGLVHPFPRPLMISPSSMAVLPGLKERLPDAYESFRHFDHHVAPDDLRPDCLSEPAAVRSIVFPSYVKGSPTALIPITRADALTGLLRSCFNFPELKGRAVRALARIASEAACYRLSIGATEPAVHLIQGLLEENSWPSVSTGPARSRS